MKSESCSVVSNSTTPWTTQSVEYSRPEYKNTRVGSYSLLQGIVPTQGLNPGLPHCRQILYQLSHQGSIYTYTHTHTHTHTYIFIYIHTHIYVFFLYSFILIYHRMLNIVLCAFRVGPCCLSVLYILVYICQSQTSNTSLFQLPFSFATTSIFSVCESVSIS